MATLKDRRNKDKHERPSGISKKGQPPKVLLI